MTDTPPLLEQLEKLQKEATPAPPWKYGWDYGSCDDSAELIVTLVNNLPQILQALRVQEAAPDALEALEQHVLRPNENLDIAAKHILEGALQSNQEGEPRK